MIRRGLGRAGRPSLLGTIARTAVVAGTAAAVSGVPTQSARRPDPVLTQLQQLGDLKERGLLTDDEFAAQKARLLAE